MHVKGKNYDLNISLEQLISEVCKQGFLSQNIVPNLNGICT